VCYSLEASINAGLGLGLAGIVLTKRAWAYDRSMICFAMFPLIFSLHQFVEAVNWYGLENPFPGKDFFLYLYTIIAFLFWPIFTPIAAAVADHNEKRREFWHVMTVCGIILAFYLSIKLAGANGIDVSVVKHSLAYDPLFDRPPLMIDAIYVALTVVPLVCLDNRAIKIFGGAVFFTFIYAVIEARQSWYSVWCMSAAGLSLILAFAVKREPRKIENKLERLQ